MIKLLICDDSVLIRRILKDIAAQDPEIEVVGEAKNGIECLEMIEKLKPDVVTMDIEMPRMNGMEALKKLNKKKDPTPVVMISTLTTEGASKTMEALELGAVDFLPKPENFFAMSQDAQKKEIIEKIKCAAKVRKKPQSIFDSGRRSIFAKKAPAKTDINKRKEIKFNNLVLIGSSTGGPRALQSVIPKFDANVDCAIVIVQHMPAKFTKSLADRLNQQSILDVKEAEEGDIIYKGIVYIAPGDYHLKLKKERDKLVVKLDQGEKWMNLRPTVDNMFESAASITGYNKIAVLMTGMGTDGTKGLRTLKAQGCKSIVQNEATSVVYGMPKSAVEANLVDEVVPLEEMANVIAKYMEV